MPFFILQSSIIDIFVQLSGKLHFLPITPIIHLVIVHHIVNWIIHRREETTSQEYSDHRGPEQPRSLETAPDSGRTDAKDFFVNNSESAE